MLSGSHAYLMSLLLCLSDLRVPIVPYLSYADQLDVEGALLGCLPNVGLQLTESLYLLLNMLA